MAGLSGLSGLNGAAAIFGSGIESPLTIGGMILWLRADVGAYQDVGKTIPAISDGDALAAWEDQSGNGNDVLQGTGANRPILRLDIVNEKPVIEFDGVDDFMSVALDLNLGSNDNLTIFTVTRSNDTAIFHSIIGNINTAGGNHGMRVSYNTDEKINFRTRQLAPPLDTLLTAIQSDLSFVIGTSQLKSGIQLLYRNSILQVTGTQVDMTGHSPAVFIGSNHTAGARLDGEIAEVLIYDQDMIDNERASIEQFLNAKYAIF